MLCDYTISDKPQISISSSAEKANYYNDAKQN